MANLIITIVSIALVAVMALMAVWYGGSAFVEGSAKATGATIVAQAQQISGAMTLWANQNGGSFGLNNATNFYTRSVPDLVPAFLSAWPIVPREHMAPSGSFWDGKYNWVTVIANDGISVMLVEKANPNALLIGFATTDAAFDVCRRAYRAANGLASGDGIPRSPSDSYVYRRPAGIRAACYWRDVDDDGIYDSGEHAGTWFAYWLN